MTALLLALLLARAVESGEITGDATMAISKADGRLAIRNCVGCEPLDGGEVEPAEAAVVLFVRESAQVPGYSGMCFCSCDVALSRPDEQTYPHFFAHTKHALDWLDSHDVVETDVVGLFSIHPIKVSVKESTESVPQPPLTRVTRKWRIGE